MNAGLWVIPVLIMIIATFLVVRNKKKDSYKDIDEKMPATPVDGLLFGHYGSLDRTWSQVYEDVNLFWFFNFYNRELFIEQIKLSPDTMKFVVDLAPHLTTKTTAAGSKLVFNEDAKDNLRAFFNQMKDAGVLHRFDYLYPIDEPGLQVVNAEEHRKMVQAVIDVAAEYIELKNSKIAVIYLQGQDFWNIELHHVLGIDAYKQLSQVLTIGEHARLLKAKLPHQKTFIIPGSGFGQNPDPFVAYAHNHPDEVEGVISFLFFEYQDQTQKDANFTGLENRDDDFRERWIDAGYRVMNKQRTTLPWSTRFPLAADLFKKS